MRSTISFLLLLGVLVGCSSEAKWKPVSLLDYGMPVTILAPDSAEIKKMNLLLQEDVSVKKGDGYYVQIFAAQASTRNVDELVKGVKEDVLNNPFFAEMVQEFPDGFIYRDQIDSTHTTYGFRYARIIGDKEYVFQTGLTGAFTEEQVRQMYDAVHYEEKK